MVRHRLLFATAALAGFAVFTGCGLDDADYQEPCGSTKACAYELTCHARSGSSRAEAVCEKPCDQDEDCRGLTYLGGRCMDSDDALESYSGWCVSGFNGG
ncbi:MAG: hypothetical protein U0270_14605 [Labilithrix sp.]